MPGVARSNLSLATNDDWRAVQLASELSQLSFATIEQRAGLAVSGRGGLKVVSTKPGAVQYRRYALVEWRAREEKPTTGSMISIESVKKSGKPTSRGSRNEIEAAACAASYSRSGTSAGVGSADLRTTVTIEIHVSAPSPDSLLTRLG